MTRVLGGSTWGRKKSLALPACGCLCEHGAGQAGNEGRDSLQRLGARSGVGTVAQWLSHACDGGTHTSGGSSPGSFTSNPAPDCHTWEGSRGRPKCLDSWLTTGDPDGVPGYGFGPAQLQPRQPFEG